ncbi:DUF4190 domain-containing protein [Streptomyces sp. GESEQ-35]|uniref:DUF4190 domain-containing protein n=1 Tax=Streptomyces sp. GESEQ-35 TaxID=2812657 RepID=UPI001FF40F8D|nr:DUF4190 domain-containing protein [Streptomyces sp. GESEQ-35]
MSDDAQTPEARDNAAAHWPTPPDDTGDPWAAAGGAAADAAEVPLAEGADPEVDLKKGDRAESGSETVADARPEPNPWAPPANDTPPAPGPGGPGTTVASGEPMAWPASSASPSSPTSSPSDPSVHDRQTATWTPSTGAPPATPDGNQAWANPVAPDADQGQPQAPQPSQPWANPFAPPTPTPPANGSANPFAPPAPASPYAAHGEPVPPPPIAPDGPGQVPYGYPAGHGYPAGPGYPSQSGAGYYGWPGVQQTPANGMGTAGLVLGILAAVVFCLWPVAIVLGILAVIFGALGRGKARRGEATNPGQALGGIICGAVGIVLAIGVFALVLAI